jgi:hypothetical protein
MAYEILNFFLGVSRGQKKVVVSGARELSNLLAESKLSNSTNEISQSREQKGQSKTNLKQRKS